MSLRQDIQRRLSALRSERASWVDHWRELQDYILPLAGRFLAAERNKGSRRNNKLIDMTATYSASILASGLMAGVTSPARPWFQLRVEDPSLNERFAVKAWLDNARDRMNEVFLRSNLYTVLPVTYSDLGTFSTSAFAVLEDEDKVIRCHPFPIGSYMLATSHTGRVDTCYREYQMTAAQMVAQFGKDNVSAQVAKASKEAPDTWFDVVHAIEPNPDHDPEKLESRRKAFRSVYLERGSTDEKVLSEAGFDEFPIMAPRWQVCGEDVYGHGPGMMALGDIKALQLEQKKKIQAIEKGITPPMSAPSSLKNAPASLLPGGFTYVDVHQGQQGVTPIYQVAPGWLAPLTEDIREVQARIRKAFFEDLFLMMANDDRSGVTAQEIVARNEEKMLVLGPVLTRLNDELLDPLIERTFAIMLRRGHIPPPPEDLAGSSITVEYISVMAQAMKMAGISGVEHLAQFTGSMGSAFPEVLDRFDADEAVAAMASMLGTPPKLVRDTEQVQKIRQGRAQEQQAQQAMAVAQQGAQTAQTLSQTNVTDPSALSQMIQMAQGGAIA